MPSTSSVDIHPDVDYDYYDPPEPYPMNFTGYCSVDDALREDGPLGAVDEPPPELMFDFNPEVYAPKISGGSGGLVPVILLECDSLYSRAQLVQTDATAPIQAPLYLNSSASLVSPLLSSTIHQSLPKPQTLSFPAVSNSSLGYDSGLNCSGYPEASRQDTKQDDTSKVTAKPRQAIKAASRRRATPGDFEADCVPNKSRALKKAKIGSSATNRTAAASTNTVSVVTNLPSKISADDQAHGAPGTMRCRICGCMVTFSGKQKTAWLTHLQLYHPVPLY